MRGVPLTAGADLLQVGQALLGVKPPLWPKRQALTSPQVWGAPGPLPQAPAAPTRAALHQCQTAPGGMRQPGLQAQTLHQALQS